MNKEELRKVLEVKERQYAENKNMHGIRMAIIRQTCLLLGIGGDDVFETLDKNWCCSLTHPEFQKESIMWINRAGEYLDEYRNKIILSDFVLPDIPFQERTKEDELERRFKMLESQVNQLIWKVLGDE